MIKHRSRRKQFDLNVADLIPDSWTPAAAERQKLESEDFAIN